MRFKNKVALVTGGNSGIGRGIVRRFVTEGARVAIVGRDEAKGRDTLAEMRALGGDVEFYQADLGSEAAARDMVEAVARRFGRIDILVNNAGAGARRSGVRQEDPPGERLRKLMRSNLEAAYYVAAYAMPHLRDAGGGAIVNISSTATFHGHWGNYGIVKAGVEALSRSLAVEGAPHGVRANSVSPGWIDTEAVNRDADKSWQKGVSLLGRSGTPAEIAGAVCFLASEDAAFITGTTLIVDGGLMITDYASLDWLDKMDYGRLFAGLVAPKREAGG
jgi:NAD(P)-dependent dehydrogenase (short-subunit alcohol dehydrogenase family)